MLFTVYQRFQKCEYVRTKLIKTEGRGCGLLIEENIKVGQFIIEYCGEVISSEEAKQRSETYEAQGLKDAYIISLDANSFIDATQKGSLARFINHSCQPNCETRKWTVLGETRVGIFAKQDICVGTELAYDYNFEWYGGATVRCLCGAANCSIFLGAKSHGFQVYNHVWEDGDDSCQDAHWNCGVMWMFEFKELITNRMKTTCVLFDIWKHRANGLSVLIFYPFYFLPSAIRRVYCLLCKHSTYLFECRYTVEEIPLYDSAEDEPSLKLPNTTSSFKSESIVTEKSYYPMIIDGTVGSEHQLESNARSVESLCSVPLEGAAMNTGKAERTEDMKLYSQDSQPAFPQKNVMASNIRSDSAGRNFNIGPGSDSKKRSQQIPNRRSKHLGRKQVNAKDVARLFASKEAREEVMEYEEIKNQATSNLNAVYDQIRPAIEEHERDSQDNVPIAEGEKWIKSECSKLKAEFNFHFSIVKNAVCPPQKANGETKPEGGDDEQTN
ncbi:unnamed protein product [Ilex paraguariensis]|uniref:Histone-lysine N-methyltransferase ASHH1 n=1 Tax=Ilex paraguariensis TaxID=185542 RepID=A0ABC8SBC5_9AQUA